MGPKKLGEQSHKFIFIHSTHDYIGLQKLLAVPGKLLNPDLQHLARQRSRIISLKFRRTFLHSFGELLGGNFRGWQLAFEVGVNPRRSQT
jgi:hypothetical protein